MSGGCVVPAGAGWWLDGGTMMVRRGTLSGGGWLAVLKIVRNDM